MHGAIPEVFDGSGKLIKKIYEPEDEDFRPKAEAHDSDYFNVDTNSGNPSVWTGDAVHGSAL